jgi:hypothetical protein
MGGSIAPWSPYLVLWNHCELYMVPDQSPKQLLPMLLNYSGYAPGLTRRVSLVEQELPTLPEHPSSLPVFSGVRVTRSLVWCVCFVDHCLPFCTFYLGHCVVCSSWIYGFWLPIWYLQALLILSRARITYIFCSSWNLTFIVYFRSSSVMAFSIVAGTTTLDKECCHGYSAFVFCHGRPAHISWLGYSAFVYWP